MKTIVASGLFLSLSCAQAIEVSCVIRATTCIATQGTKISPERVISLSDTCEKFTERDVGRRALQLSFAQIEHMSKGRLTPLKRAWLEYESLHDSELRFDRAVPIEQRYPSIKAACGQLIRDFNDDSKWVK